MRLLRGLQQRSYGPSRPASGPPPVCNRERSAGVQSSPYFSSKPRVSSTRPAIEHALRPLIDSLVQGLAIRIEPQSHDAEPLQWITALLPHLAHFRPRGQADFNGPQQFGDVIGVNLRGSGRIETAQDSMQVACPLLFSTLRATAPAVPPNVAGRQRDPPAKRADRGQFLRPRSAKLRAT